MIMVVSCTAVSKMRNPSKKLLMSLSNNVSERPTTDVIVGNLSRSMKMAVCMHRNIKT